MMPTCPLDNNRPEVIACAYQLSRLIRQGIINWVWAGTPAEGAAFALWAAGIISMAETRTDRGLGGYVVAYRHRGGGRDRHATVN